MAGLVHHKICVVTKETVNGREFSGLSLFNFRLICVMIGFNIDCNCNYRNLPNRGAGRDSKVKSDTRE